MTTPVGVMALVAQTVSGTHVLDEALGFVVRATRQFLGVRRATILLLDEEGLLVPAVSSAHEENVALYRTFRTMAPITVTLEEQARSLLAAGRAIAIERAAESTLVPEQWREVFGLECLAIVPLLSLGVPCGVLVVDAPSGHPFTPDQLTALEGMAASASTAVRRARDYAATMRRAACLSRILSLTHLLNAAHDRRAVTATALEALCDLFSAESCSLSLVAQDATGFTTIGTRGLAQPSHGWHSVAEIHPLQESIPSGGDPLVFTLDARAWPFGPVRPTDKRVTGVLLPLLDGAHRRGFALVGLRPTAEPPTSEELELATSVMGQVWLALERARLTAALSRRSEVQDLLRGLDAELVRSPDLSLVVERLAGLVREGTSAELLDLRLAEPAVARLLGCPPAAPALATVMRTWRHQEQREPCVVAGLVAVPVSRGDELVGALLLRGVPAELTAGPGADLVQDVAAAVADLLCLAAGHRREKDLERCLAVAAERELIERDLRSELASLLSAGADRLRRACRQPRHDSTPDEVAAALSLVTNARVQLRAGDAYLPKVQIDRRGLATSLRDLAATLDEASGATVSVRVMGTAQALSPEVERVLLRCAYEGLVKVERQTRATVVSVVLRYRPDRVELLVQDDGLELSARSSELGLHSALRTMQRRLETLGGRLEVLHGKTSQGIRLLAVVPVPASRHVASYAPAVTARS